jgi:putative transcriptional regulator
MIEIFQNKNSATRFQILVQIAAYRPNIQQKHIATSLGITPQAVSDYIHQLIREEFVISTGRSRYQVSIRGVNWVLEMFREMRDYMSLVARAVNNITVCAAIAESDITEGQTVGLKMKNGFLFATSQPDNGARGIALSNVRQGEDLNVSNIEGVVELTKGKVTILQIPSIRKGGSRHTDMARLKARIDNSQQIGAIGIESLVALRLANIEPQYLYGVTEAAVEAVRCGLPFTVVCSDDAISGLIKKLQDEELEYEIVDLIEKTAR